MLVNVSVNVSWLSKTQVLSARDVDYDLSGLKKRLLPQLDLEWTCGRQCTSDSECKDCWICCWCVFDSTVDAINHRCGI